MESPDIYQTLEELLPFLYGMWGLFLVLAGWMLIRARHLDPHPFLPLMVLVLTVHVGLKLTAVWFVLTFEVSDPISFPEYWESIMDPVVIRPLTIIFCGLSIHALIYAFSELRYSKQKEKLTPSTRALFHIILIMVGMTMWVHYRIFDEIILMQRRNFDRLPGKIEFDGYGLESSAGSPPDFKVQLYPDSLF
jgi:hypothetical protein